MGSSTEVVTSDNLIHIIVPVILGHTMSPCHVTQIKGHSMIKTAFIHVLLHRAKGCIHSILRGGGIENIMSTKKNLTPS